MNQQQGFALIELIAVIVLVGIIAAFSTFFLYTGFNGYVDTKNATEGALNAQMALDRISIELRNISEIIPTPSATSITFKCSYKSQEQAGTRTLKWLGDKIMINVDSEDYPLLEDVKSFTLKYPPNNDGGNEVASIEVEFELNDIGKKFKTNIFPRNMVEKTW
jgi:prepilin-type N-terminal cleavage/methylation domain-containing protein